MTDSQTSTLLRDASVTGSERALFIEDRYSGLPGLAQGGYVGGLLAEEFGTATVEVRLRRPVPTGRPLTVAPSEEGGVELRDAGASLAVGRPTELDADVPAPPSPAQATAAAGRFPGHHTHPYPGCFACGPDRRVGDGLRVFPGPVTDGRPLVAATWLPPDERGGGHVGAGLIWAAFDCAQLWSLMLHEPSSPGERVVTASLATELRGEVEPMVEHVIYAWPIGRAGDRIRAGAALADPDGLVVAAGVQTAVLANWGVPLAIDESA